MALLICLSAVPLLADENIADCQQYADRCYPMPRIDVVFLIDSTGSMADEIREVKTHIIKIVKDVESGQPSPDIRVGVVTYRDHEKEEREYVYRKFELSNDVESALNFIEGIQAQGGGDLPEAVADGLNAAINSMNWDSYAKKIVFLIGDAPPHGEGSPSEGPYYVQGCPDGYNYKDLIEDAVENDIVIYTVSGSGMDYAGVRIWQEIASKTGGEYSQLSYERVDVEQYVAEEGIDPAWAAEIKKDSDYDSKTNTFLKNTFGSVAKAAVISEAKEMGVRYDDSDDATVNDNSWIDVKDITGDAVKEDKEEPKSIGFLEFLDRIFDKLIFWD